MTAQAGAIVASVTEVPNGIDAPITISGAVYLAARRKASTVAVPATRLGPTVRTRTFKLQAHSGQPFSIDNGGSSNRRSVIYAEAR